MVVKYWGVRGSLPSSLSPQQLVKDFEQHLRGFFRAGYSRPEHIDSYIQSLSIPRLGGFGTATTCVQVTTAQTSLIIDAGSGLRRLGEQILLKSPETRPQSFHIYFTHFHWDHMLGLPFFAPLFWRNVEIHLYAVQDDLEEAVKMKFRKPFFPVAYESLPAKIIFHKLKPRQPFMIEDLKMTPYKLDHPDPCWGLRVECGGRVYSHCVDTEGTRVTREELGEDLPLYQNVNVMFYDAQYTLPELAEKANWGHSAAQIGLDLAFQENIEKVIFAHHDPGVTTEDLYNLIEQTKEYYSWRQKTAETNLQKLPEVRWRFAYEDLTIKV